MNQHIIDVTQDNFAEVVIEGSHQNYIVVDFWATWCEPCKQLVPLLEKLSSEFGYVLAKVNTEQQQELAQKYGVRSIPDVRIYKDSAVVEQFTGALSEGELRQLFSRFMAAAPSAVEQSIDLFLQLAADGEKEQARVGFSQLLEANPDNSDIKLDYAKLLMELGEQEQAYTLLNEIKPGDELYSIAQNILALGQFQLACIELEKVNKSDQSARLYAEASCAVINSDPETALDKFLSIVKTDRSFNDDAARKAILEVFDMLGEHPIVRQYQRKLAILLN